LRSFLANAISECNSLRATNTTLVAENASLRQQICKLKQLDEVGRHFPILSHHLESLMQSVYLLAPRYGATMKPFYLLAASMGETLYGLFDSFLGFPSWRQVQQYRDSRHKVLGLHEDIFSLSLENFRSLAPRYMPDSSDTRVCLAIDAVSHKAHVLIDLRTGRVAGLTEPFVLDPHTIDVLVNDPDAFGRFLCDCAYRVAKFSFVFYLTRLDLREKAFPMAILLSAQGQATDTSIQSISRARQILKDEGVNVRGLAFDGNIKYLSFLRPFKRQVERIQELNLHRPLSGIVANNGPGIFEDVLHLLKTIRYLLSHLWIIFHCPSPLRQRSLGNHGDFSVCQTIF
jgi:hypothetical protein